MMFIKRFDAEDFAEALRHEVEARQRVDRERAQRLSGPHGETWAMWNAFHARRDWQGLQQFEGSDECQRALHHCIEVLQKEPDFPNRESLLSTYRNMLKQEQAEEASAPAKRKRVTQADRIAEYLSECEQRAAKLNEPFDRERMPGTKVEFLALLHALDPELRSIKTVESADRHLRAAGCKWPLTASAQPAAARLYTSLFPEAHMRTPGAVSPKRRKA